MSKFSFIIIFSLLIVNNTFSQQNLSQTIALENVKLLHKPLLNMEINPYSRSEKSVFLAVMTSLLVPGLGELYVGSFETGKYHLIAEGSLWLTYVGIRKYSDWIRKDAYTYAKQHASANFDNKDEQYDVNVGNFNNMEEYNQAKSRNREYDMIYSGDDYFWDWRGVDTDRLRFKDLRIRSSEIRNNAKFVIAAVVINHIVSAFTAGRKASAYNKSLSRKIDEGSHSTLITTTISQNGVNLNLITHF
jgi:hypothetical protein